MAFTQKMYLGEVPVIKNYLGEDPIASFQTELSVVSDGLIHYFNSQENTTATQWRSLVSDRTGSINNNTILYYNSTDKLIEFNGSAGVPVLSFGTPTPITGNPPASHSVFVFTKPKAESSLMNLEFMGQSGGGVTRNVALQFRNDVDSTNYFVFVQDGLDFTSPYYGTTIGEITINDWHFVGYTYSGGVLTNTTLYHNTLSAPYSGSNQNMRIENQFWEMGSEGGVGAYSGSVGALLVYDRVLSADEVKFNYDVLTSQFT